jgi:hypothetical protein
MWIVYGIGVLIALSSVVALIGRIKKIPVQVAEKARIEGLAADTQARATQLTSEFDARKTQLEEREVQLGEARASIKALGIEARVAVETLSREKALGFPWLASAYSDYLKLYEVKLADYLEHKERPAVRAADAIRAMVAEKAALRKENRILRETFRYYENLFPWLSDFQGEELDELIQQAQVQGNPEEDEQSQEGDPAAQWLTEGEQLSRELTVAEKYQRALDRYWRTRKTPWRLGRDYERYIGYQQEQQGFKVDYTGIKLRVEDMGRDLVCRKGNEVRIVQCKYWSKNKMIHEKHVCQIYGTAIAYQRKEDAEISNRTSCGTQQLLFTNLEQASAWLYVSCPGSPRAKDFAQLLGVTFIDNYPLQRYPIIKCNVSLRTGEKIYHLPFDQQYDNTLIEYQDECYVETVAEAEALGFRRAFRWRGQQPD